MLESLNKEWFLSVNAVPGTPDGLIELAKFCAQYTLYLIPALLLGLWFLGDKYNRNQALACAITALVALGLGALCSKFYFHPRPFMIPLGHTWIFHAADTSFPSDHGTLFFSAGIALMLHRARAAGGFLLVVSLFVAWSRVFLGVHFPFDMLGALLVAIIANTLVFPVWEKYGGSATTLCESVSNKLFFKFPLKG
ncbi:bacitracin transport permease BCRC [Mangrovibacter sp. MFB070]|uniref:undecaprenyl-diphosphatase n=1 Tax=Mangrovibacter sp. MFB070 TaxID=1224318 RepID=UPI0004D4C918|nr:undecaprenyl-diphosphatase [Mangrovibacter sp. MFB070]KEA52635.1 bacitracin transport permease BCRC [Mangrovibacter sp. MFB070]